MLRKTFGTFVAAKSLLACSRIELLEKFSMSCISSSVITSTAALEKKFAKYAFHWQYLYNSLALSCDLRQYHSPFLLTYSPFHFFSLSYNRPIVHPKCIVESGPAHIRTSRPSRFGKPRTRTPTSSVAMDQRLPYQPRPLGRPREELSQSEHRRLRPCQSLRV